MNKGALHRRLKVPLKKKIPTGKIRRDLKKAKKARNKKAVKQDVYALNFRKGK